MGELAGWEETYRQVSSLPHAARVWPRSILGTQPQALRPEESDGVSAWALKVSRMVGGLRVERRAEPHLRSLGEGWGVAGKLSAGVCGLRL